MEKKGQNANDFGTKMNSHEDFHSNTSLPAPSTGVA